MYKLLLCWRYLLSRYIALASIISVTLGVATMIVVNSVMSGFTVEMQQRIHGILSDVIFESRSLEGFRDPDWHMEQIRRAGGGDVEAMTPTVVVPAMLSFRHGGEWINRQIHLIGVDAATQGEVSEFARYLQHPENRRGTLSFELHEGGYDVRDHQGGESGRMRPQMSYAGWEHRRRMAEVAAFERRLEEGRRRAEQDEMDQGGPPGDLSAEAGDAPYGAPSALVWGEADGDPPGAWDEGPEDESLSAEGPPLVDPFARRVAEQAPAFDPATEQHDGLVLGIALSAYRTPDGEERFLVLPGDDVKLTFPTAGTPPSAVSADFTVVDFYESKMSEYDASFVFVPIEALQRLRGMIDPSTGVGMVNSIQIKLRDGADGAAVRDRIAASFSPELYSVQTWRDKQGPLLAAVEMETALLNVLLFLIIAVAGFGILGIFLMIVVEKTKDIGILKSLGATGSGIMGIFLTYGLSLGLVGSGAGLILGLIFVAHINEIAVVLGHVTGRPVFDPSIYYFYSIPTVVEPFTVAWIKAGAVSIAVLASVMPALRAAWMHPVEALRYE